MSDRMPDGPPTADRQAAGSRDRLGLSVAETADRLGVTPDAVRGRLHRGTLDGEKVGTAWRVFLPLAPPTVGRQDATAGQPVGRQDATVDQQEAAVDRRDTDGAGDAPLVALVADLARRNEELAAAAALWQARAGHLEDHLKQLTAGDATTQQPPVATPAPPGAAAWPATGGDDGGAGVGDDGGGVLRRVWDRLVGKKR